VNDGAGATDPWKFTASKLVACLVEVALPSPNEDVVLLLGALPKLKDEVEVVRVEGAALLMGVSPKLNEVG
jgi:hypothetical protein